MVDTFVNVLAFCGTFFTLFGMFFFVRAIFFPGKPPVDKSNVWNRLIAPVYVAMNPEVFGGIKFFRNDVGENMVLVEKAFLEKLMKKEDDHVEE